MERQRPKNPVNDSRRRKSVVMPLVLPAIDGPDKSTNMDQEEISRFGLSFTNEKSQEEYRATVFSPEVLVKLRRNLFIAALVLFCLLHFSHVTSENNSTQDVLFWATKLVLPLWLIGLGCAFKRSKGSGYCFCILCLICVLFHCGVLYVHMQMFCDDAHEILSHQKRQNFTLSETSNDIYILRTASTASMTLWSVGIFMVSMHGFYLRFKYALVLASCCTLAQVLWIGIVEWRMRDMGVLAGAEFVQTRITLVMVIIVLFVLQKQWHSELLEVLLFRHNLHLTKMVKFQAFEKQENVSLDALVQVVEGGYVKQMVADIFSDNQSRVQQATKHIEKFVSAAKEVVPLTANDKKGIAGNSGTADCVNEEVLSDFSPTAQKRQLQQQVAAARTGLEVAKAWVDRVAGHSKWIGDKVFLGGSCNPTTWRQDVAIPVLKAAGVPFYNPQVDDWHAGLVAEEAMEKETAGCLLFVIDRQTRALASLVEASEYMCRGRHVVLCILDILPGTQFGADGVPINATELKDLNRVRSYLRDVATRHGVPFTDDVNQAMRTVIKSHRKDLKRRERELEDEKQRMLALQQKQQSFRRGSSTLRRRLTGGAVSLGGLDIRRSSGGLPTTKTNFLSLHKLSPTSTLRRLNPSNAANPNNKH